MNQGIESIQGALRSFIESELRHGAAIDDRESLLDGGILDSMSITRLNEYIESRFGVNISDADFEPENYETITAIAQMIHDRLERSDRPAQPS
ncbi:MAG: phosphopantetheine-binding protein [Proteobacteria bacterium]|nr:phosphopantetheine-binding protein [Pseudomonadota bacterium]